MTWHGIIQTADGDEAVRVAFEQLNLGRPIRTERHCYPGASEDPNSGHDDIEYEVYADIPDGPRRCPHCGASENVHVETGHFWNSLPPGHPDRGPPRPVLVRAYPGTLGRCNYCGE